MTVQPPSDGSRLADRLQVEGWTVRTQPGTGTWPVNDPDRPNCGCGKRHDRYIDAPHSSWRITAAHPDGRGFIAWWAHRHGDLTPKRQEVRWTYDGGLRIAAAGELTAQPLTARELTAYTAPTTEQENVA